MENPHNFENASCSSSFFFLSSVVSHRKRQLMSPRRGVGAVFATADLEYRIYHPPKSPAPAYLLIARMTRSSGIYIIQTVRYLASSHIPPPIFHSSRRHPWCKYTQKKFFFIARNEITFPHYRIYLNKYMEVSDNYRFLSLNRAHTSRSLLINFSLITEKLVKR